MLNKEIVSNEALYASVVRFSQPTFGSADKYPQNWMHDRPAYRLFEDGSVEINYYAPDAKSVSVKGNGGSMPESYELTPADGGWWTLRTDKIAPGFHYVYFTVDGVLAMNPLAPLGYGCSMPMNFIEIPDEESDFYLLKDVPHGTVRMSLYYAMTTERYRNCWVYTPPGYETSPEKRYPVLYLQHGGGENETGWIWQGKLNLIIDNLLAEGACKEMIVVMNSGSAFKEMWNGTKVVESSTNAIVYDCVPFIDANFRTIPERESRCIAGLSMGSFLANVTCFEHLDVFANLGILSGGFMIDATFMGYEFNYSEHYASAEIFNSKMKMMHISGGEKEGAARNRALAEKYIEQGYNISFFTARGYHEWDTWRYSSRDLIKRLFN